jgi:hypothetical protein
MGDNLGASTGICGANNSKVQQANMNKSGVAVTSVGLFGILIAMMLINRGIEINPSSQMEKMERLLLSYGGIM